MDNTERATARINAAITPSTKARLERQAETSGRSVAGQLSWLVNQYEAGPPSVDESLRDEIRMFRIAMSEGFDRLTATLADHSKRIEALEKSKGGAA